MRIFYFTGTGNSLVVAKALGDDIRSIPQLVNFKQLEHQDDAIGFVFPVYSHASPRFVREFISKANLKADYFFAIGTYGKSAGNCMADFEEFAAEHGIKLDYTNTVLMVNNYLPMYDIKEEKEKIPSKKIEESIAKVAEDIKARKKSLMKPTFAGKFEGLFCTLLAKTIDNGTFAEDFTVNDRCFKCITCIKLCPRHNISLEEDGIKFGDNCEGCMSCINFCPKNAIHIKGEKSNARWTNPDVTLRNIIDSNQKTSKGGL